MWIQVYTMDQQQYKIWFAGFYEGEGSISNDINNRNRLRISVSQNDVTPLEIGQSIWGGFIRARTRTSVTGKICKGNEWVMNHNQSLQFIEDIKSYMIIPYKKEQITRALDKSNGEWIKRFKCSFDGCECDFADPSGRRRHEKTFHIENNEIHICDICNKKYSSKCSLNRHYKSHNSVASVLC